jgi:two-component system, OmpR family, phosphate regulon sensor histidine kinase PhoR
MANIRRKVNQYLWGTLASAFLVLFIIISYLIHGYNTMLKVDQYKTQGEIFAEIIKSDEVGPHLYTYFEQLANRDSDASFTYYSQSGQVLYTNSPTQPKTLTVDNRLNGSDWISFNSKGAERIILPIKDREQLYGYLEVKIKTSILNSHLKSLWLLLLIFFVAIIFIIIYILDRFSKRFLEPVENSIKTVKELAKGNFKVRLAETTYDSDNDLGQAVNILSRSFQQILKSHELQQDRLKTLIENMGSGLILIDAKGYVSLVNKAFLNQFQLQKNNILEELYHEVLPYEEIINLIKEIYLIEQSVRRLIMLTFPIERRHFEVYGAPIMSSSQKLEGIALVFHDITELKKLEQTRKDFVANVSHELRTPVTSLKGFAETLLDGAMENPEIREKFLSIIWKESDRLQSLIQDLLELSKIEQDNFNLNWQSVDLRHILDDVILLLKHKANEKEIRLSCESKGNPIIMGDTARIKQIMINIINNSLTYTANGGFCSVLIEDKGEDVRVTVQDNGIGINKEEIPRIFERFYRIDKARSRNSGGTGLGLAIVKHLVDAHKGIIKVESEQGKGTKFKIIFKKEI